MVFGGATVTGSASAASPPPLKTADTTSPILPCSAHQSCFTQRVTAAGLYLGNLDLIERDVWLATLPEPCNGDSRNKSVLRAASGAHLSSQLLDNMVSVEHAPPQPSRAVLHNTHMRLFRVCPGAHSSVRAGV